MVPGTNTNMIGKLSRRIIYLKVYTQHYDKYTAILIDKKYVWVKMIHTTYFCKFRTNFNLFPGTKVNFKLIYNASTEIIITTDHDYLTTLNVLGEQIDE